MAGKKFPKNPKKGDIIQKVVNNRTVTFEATGQEGFGKWTIIANEPIEETRDEAFWKEERRARAYEKKKREEEEQEPTKKFWKEAMTMEKKAENPLKQRLKKLFKISPQKKTPGIKQVTEVLDLLDDKDDLETFLDKLPALQREKLYRHKLLKDYDLLP